MSFKVNDQVRILPFAYNITDTRVGMKATVSRIDEQSVLLPVRVEYADGNYDWTNYESLFLLTPAPPQNAVVGAEILDKMQELKASVATRDAAVKLVVEQTEALDALLASVGLKRGEEIPAIPAPVARTALDDYKDGTVEEGFKYVLETPTRISAYLTSGRVYVVSSLDLDDSAAPIAFADDDGDDYYPSASKLNLFTRIA